MAEDLGQSTGSTGTNPDPGGVDKTNRQYKDNVGDSTKPKGKPSPSTPPFRIGGGGQ